MNREGSDPMAAKATSAAISKATTQPSQPQGSQVKERSTAGKGRGGKKASSKSPKEGKSVKEEEEPVWTAQKAATARRPCSTCAAMRRRKWATVCRWTAGPLIPPGMLPISRSAGTRDPHSHSQTAAAATPSPPPELDQRATAFGSSGVTGTGSHTTTLLEKNNKATYGGRATTSSKLAEQSLPEVASTLPTDNVNKVGKWAGTGEGLEKVGGGKSRKNAAASSSSSCSPRGGGSKSVMTKGGGSPRGGGGGGTSSATGPLKTSPSRAKSARRGKSASPSKSTKAGPERSNKSRKQAARSVSKISSRGKATAAGGSGIGAKSNKQKSRTEAKSRR
ncbi:hypothetical protein TYRP_001029 [Tyrophagus putrescentiae]|nr:hypothetical protein TYRP_001029 [Tyrophagus putrescentiae]